MSCEEVLSGLCGGAAKNKKVMKQCEKAISGLCYGISCMAPITLPCITYPATINQWKKSTSCEEVLSGLCGRTAKK